MIIVVDTRENVIGVRHRSKTTRVFRSAKSLYHFIGNRYVVLFFFLPKANNNISNLNNTYGGGPFSIGFAIIIFLHSAQKFYQLVCSV